MATIPNTQKILTSSASVDTTYGGSTALKEMNTWYTMQDIIETVGELPYTSYSALVNQTSTNPPTSTILSNDTTLTFTWSYVGVGIYDLNISSAVNLNKILVLSSIQFYNGPSVIALLSFVQNDSTSTKLRFRCAQTSGTATNSLLLNHGLEIRVYE